MKARYVIHGYETMDSKGDVKDVSFIRVEAKHGIEALEKAKKLVEKTHYRIADVSEITEPAKLPITEKRKETR